MLNVMESNRIKKLMLIENEIQEHHGKPLEHAKDFVKDMINEEHEVLEELIAKMLTNEHCRTVLKDVINNHFKDDGETHKRYFEGY